MTTATPAAVAPDEDELRHEEDDLTPPELSYEEERGKPMPSNNHGIIQARLIGEFLKHREFEVISELTLRLSDRKLTPDVSLYPRAPLDLTHDIIERTDPPLLAVEILSPMQGSSVVLEKVQFYLAQGVKSVWLVGPAFHQIAIYTAEAPPRYQLEGIVTDPVLGVTADLAAVFS